MSMYADYLTERTNDQIREYDNGFITWRYLNDREIYIVDLFVEKEFRQLGLAKQMADDVLSEAKEKGYSILVGSVWAKAKNASESLQVLLNYGMKIVSATNDGIILSKEF